MIAKTGDDTCIFDKKTYNDIISIRKYKDGCNIAIIYTSGWFCIVD